jgi:hypothetical protein
VDCCHSIALDLEWVSVIFPVTLYPVLVPSAAE